MLHHSIRGTYILFGLYPPILNGVKDLSQLI